MATGVCGFFNFESRLSEKLANIKLLIRALRSGVAYSKFSTLPEDLWAVGLSLFPLAVRYIRDRKILAFFDKALDFHVQAEQLPAVESKIGLTDEGCGADGLFRATVNWKIESDEIKSIRTFAIRVDEYLQKRGIARLEIDDRILRADGSTLAVLGDTYHQCGGMCMSLSATSGVVDHDGRVWGTKNVFVAGASIFPTSSHSNCTLTAMALTGKACVETQERRLIERINVAGSSFQISRIGFGCARIYGGSELKNSARVIEAALAAGIRHFDTAPSYGEGKSEEVLGRILANVPEITISTKIGISRPPAGTVRDPARVAYRRYVKPLLSHVPLLKSKIMQLAASKSPENCLPNVPRRRLEVARYGANLKIA